MHSDTHPQVTDRVGSIDHFDVKPIVFGENTSANPFETFPEVAGDNERASSSKDLFQVDTGLGNFESHAQPSKDEEISVSNNNSSKSKAFDKSPGPTSTSQFPQVTNESMVHDMPPTRSPLRQVMDRSGEYDPLRIPSAIFERNKSLTPQEWSVASNESLFSIHIGNNSFSRDQFKSGELIKTGELIMFNPSPTVPELGDDRVVAEFEKSDATSEAVKNTENAPKETTIDKSQEKATHANVLQNPSDMSNNSNQSSRSFAFPILTDRVESMTVKPDVAEQQQKKPVAPEAIPKSSSSCCWFSCFSSHPCSCTFSCSRCFHYFRCRGCSFGCCCCRR